MNRPTRRFIRPRHLPALLRNPAAVDRRRKTPEMVRPPGAKRSKPQTSRAERRGTGTFVVTMSVH